MNKTALIIKREYLHRVEKKSFLLLTFLTPFLFAALVFVPLWLSGFKADEIRQVAIIDTTGKYAPLFEDTETYRFVRSDKDLEAYRKNPDKEIFAILQITGDLLQHPDAAALYSEKQVPGELSRLVNQVLSKQMESEKMASFQIPNLEEIIRQSRITYQIPTFKWSNDGSENLSSSEIASMTGLVFTLIIYLFILFYGAMVMQGVMEEKTNRIIEVIVSSVKPFQLMMGKIIGIGCVGLTQVFIWAVMTLALVAGGSFLFGAQAVSQAALTGDNLFPAASAEATATPALALLATLGGSVNLAEIGGLFILYFIGGYVLYASVFAAIGSAVDNQEDTQQFVVPVSLFMVFALYAGIYSLENPDGPLACWCSLIPFTSPIVMMVRLPFDVPVWQIGLSLVLLYLTAIGIVWISGKIYRTGILMYGKKSSLKEILKWIRYR